MTATRGPASLLPRWVPTPAPIRPTPQRPTGSLPFAQVHWLVEPGQSVQRSDVLARVENPQNLGRPIEVKSPIAGKIVERNGTLGGPVTTSDPLFLVSDLDTVWVTAEVREDMAGKILKEVPPKSAS